MINLSYQESICTIQRHFNHNNVRKDVMSIYSLGEDNFVREYIYAFFHINLKLTAITLRAKELPPEINPSTVNLTLEKHKEYSFKITLAPLKRTGRKETLLDESEFINFCEDILSRNGWDCKKIIIQDVERVRVFKATERHFRKVCSFYVSAEINNLELAKNSILNGIGRGRVYGYGMPVFNN